MYFCGSGEDNVCSRREGLEGYSKLYTGGRSVHYRSVDI